MCEKLPKKWICIELRIFGALAPYCAYCTTCTSNTLRPIVLSPSQQQRQHRRAHRAFPSRSLKCGDILLKLTLVKQNYVYIVSFWGFLLYLASIIPNFYLLPSRSIPLSCVCVVFLHYSHHSRAIGFSPHTQYYYCDSKLRLHFFCSFSRVCWLLHGQKRINTLEANDNSNTQIDRKKPYSANWKNHFCLESVTTQTIHCVCVSGGCIHLIALPFKIN